MWLAADVILTGDEWASPLMIMLELGDQHLRAGPEAGGGGGLITSSVLCRSDQDPPGEIDRRTPRTPFTPTRVQIRMMRPPGSRTWSCLVALPDEGSEGLGEVDMSNTARVTGALTISSGPEPFRYGARESATVERIEVWGAEPQAATDDPLWLGNLALVRGDPREALHHLPTHAFVSRAIAHTRLRRPLEAVAALRRAIGTKPLADVLPAMLRTHRDPYALLLHEALGEDYLTDFDAAWSIPVHAHRDQADVRNALWAELADVRLDDVPTHPSWRLMALRADAQPQTGEPRGLAAAQAWISAFENLPAPPVEISRLASGLHRQRSGLAEAAGDTVPATRHAQRSTQRGLLPDTGARQRPPVGT